MVDIDPRLGPALLEALQRVGIAAYVEPVGGSVGGYCEIRLPSRPTDRLWTDLRQREVARSVVARALADMGVRPDGDPVPDDGAVAAPTADSAWESVLLAWRLPLDPGPRPWPASEDVEATSPLAREPSEPAHIEPAHIEPAPSEHADADEGCDDEEEHFVPPPPPPLPRMQGPTLVALLAMVGGVIMLVTPWLLDVGDSSSTATLAVLAIVGGAGTLIWRMRETPPPGAGTGSDDGAVV